MIYILLIFAKKGDEIEILRMNPDAYPDATSEEDDKQ
jgi:hypothetical protein